MKTGLFFTAFQNRKNSSFTLIELLVVIAMIAMTTDSWLGV